MEGVYTVDTVDPSCTIISTRINLISFCARLLTRPTRRTTWSGKGYYSMRHMASLSRCWQRCNQMLWNVWVMGQGEEGWLVGFSFCWSLCIRFLLIENDKYTPMPWDFYLFFVFFCFQCVQTLVPIQFPSSSQRVPQNVPNRITLLCHMLQPKLTNGKHHNFCMFEKTLWWALKVPPSQKEQNKLWGSPSTN
jgi:hypothetical protein